jgi:hypothetical protein
MYYITGKCKSTLKKPVIYAREKESTEPGRAVQVTVGPDARFKASVVSASEGD